MINVLGNITTVLVCFAMCGISTVVVIIVVLLLIEFFKDGLNIAIKIVRKGGKE